MVDSLSCELLIQIIAATPYNVAIEQSVSGITTDSRSIAPGQVFVALRGERFDGHAFVQAAVEQGAIAAITDHILPTPEPLPLLLVEDTLIAYQAIARWWRDQFSIPIIAITGSVGKTTTKELIAAVLATQGRVWKTQANYNNEIGVPKTLLEMDRRCDYGVIEMGMRAAGEIALLTQIARPDIAVITNVGTAHIGRLGSEEAIAQAKCELLAELPASGIAILNADNPLLLATAQQVWQGSTLTYGLTAGDVRGRLLDLQTLEVEGISFPLPLPGQHNAMNYLAALTVAKVLHVDWSRLTQGVTVSLPQGRAQRHDLRDDIVILDETYNAGLESMIAALRLLAQTPGRRRIAVLGTMKELGERSPALHHTVGRVAQEVGIDRLLILADAAEQQALVEGAHPLISETFATPAELIERLRTLVQSGDRILFKASRAVGLDQVVQQVCADLTGS